ncbi:Phage-related protein [Natronoarchaeum philippinense]|uniref:Phage-related protein n=1 Tax=Natronoarchaeum philippinense TaxID=558529 RepID=A0A285P8V0_NATPI|nr:hypothetical protein [Natronoarchaeum philippinense]SNZ18179.1 Phage-related protein [Natronoarchaeum philippinense]
MPGNPLHAEVTADSADYVSAVEAAVQSSERLSDEATETAAAMHLLQGRVEKAGNEALAAGAKAGASSSGFSSLAASAASTQVSFNSLSAATLTTLIPALLALSTVMAPLLAAMGGFITVAGSIAGLGLAGFIGAVATNGEQLQSTFDQLTATIRSEFAPVFDEFARVLDTLMLSLIDTIPELVPAQDVVRELANQFLALGESIIGSLPAFAEMATTLATRFLPPFVEWTEGVLPRVPGMLQNLIPVMLEVGATLGPLAQSFVEIAPTMTEFGTRVLNIVTPALTMAVQAFDRAMDAVNSLDNNVASFVSTMTLVSPVLAKAALALASISNPAAAAAVAIGTLGAAWATNVYGIRDATSEALEETQGVVTSRFEAIAEAVQDVGSRLWSGILKPVLSLIERQWSVHGRTLIREAQQTFGTIQRTISRILRGIYRTTVRPVLRLMTQAWNVFGDDIMKIADAAFGTILTIAETGMDLIMTAVTVGMQVLQGDWEGAWNSIVGFAQRTWRRLVTWLQTDAISLLTGAFGLLITGAQTALNYLIGTGERTLYGDIKNVLGAIDTYLIGTGVSLIKGAFGTIVSSAKTALGYLIGTGEGTLHGDVTGVVGDIVTYLTDEFGPNAKDAIVGALRGAGEAAAEALKQAFNHAVPSSIGIDEVEIQGQTVVPEKRIDLPQLDTGGLIEEEGLYVGHPGERVLNPAETRQLEQFDQTAMAGGEVDVEDDVRRALEQADRTDVVAQKLDALIRTIEEGMDVDVTIEDSSGRHDPF